MERCHQHDLLSGIKTLHVVEGFVYPASIGGVAHHRITMDTVYHVLRLMDTCHHLFLLLNKPLSDGHTGIIVVGADEDDDGIHTVTMFLHQLVCLTGDIIPLTSADTIYVGFYLQPIVEESPVFYLRTAVSWIGDRVTEICHTLTLPGMGYHCLSQR